MRTYHILKCHERDKKNEQEAGRKGGYNGIAIRADYFYAVGMNARGSYSGIQEVRSGCYREEAASCILKTRVGEFIPVCGKGGSFPNRFRRGSEHFSSPLW